MDIALLIKAAILGVVEGLTEFLPISSTGHLILAGHLLEFNDERGKAFEVIIQLGAILAVCWEFRKKIIDVLSGLGRRPLSNRFALNVIVASIPAITLALIFGKYIKAHLFAPIPVATAFIVGGFIILWAEHLEQAKQSSRKVVLRSIEHLEDLSIKDAIKVGFAQCAALIPGTSRSGATIIGGMLFGLPRQVATEFSFFLAIPVIAGATVYELYKLRHDTGFIRHCRLWTCFSCWFCDFIYCSIFLRKVVDWVCQSSQLQTICLVSYCVWIISDSHIDDGVDQLERLK